MEINYSKQSIKYLKKLHKPKRDKILAAIKLLPDGNVRKMEGYDNLYRLRVNDYRVIFTKDFDIIFIEKIGSRGDVYKWL